MYDDADEGGATQVSDPDDPLMGAEWSVNLTEDETVVMKAHELAWEFLRGTLDPEDVFVWRDGMGDWVPIGECAEIQQIVKEYSAGQSREAPATGGAPAIDFGSTVMMDISAHDEAERMSQRSPALHAPPPPADHPLAGTHVMASDVGTADEVSRTMASPFSHAELPAQPSPPPAAAARPPRRPPPRRSPGAPPRVERDPLADILSLPTPEIGGVAAAYTSPLPLAPPGAPPPFAPPALAPPPLAPPSPGAPPAYAKPPTASPGFSQPPPPLGPAASIPPSSLNHPAVVAAQLAPRRGTPIGLVVGAALGVLVLTGGVLAFMIKRDAPSPVAQHETAAESPARASTEPAEGHPQASEPAPAATANPDPSVTALDEDDPQAVDADAKAGMETPKTGPEPSPKGQAEPKAAPAEKDTPKEEPKGEFNRDAARSALNGAASSASGCAQKGGPTGRGRVTVTFSPSGQATQASVGPPFAGTPVGGCAAAAFKRASVPPFSGGAVTVSKSFFIK